MKKYLVNHRWQGILLIGVFVLCLPKLNEAQKSDYTWLVGYDSNAHNDSVALGYTLGNMKLDFNYNPVHISYDSIGMNFDFTSTTISDSNGSLSFYTNGIYVANALDQTIVNGDSLNSGYFQYVWDPTIQQDGYRNEQGIIAIPDVNKPDNYYLIHSFIDTIPGTEGGGIYCAKILSTLVDMSANGGLGQVEYKNQTIVQDSFGFEIQATRHGNGRDWWVLVQKRNTNCFYRILIDTGGIHVMPDLSCLGPEMEEGQIGAECFSPDGGKFVYLCSNQGLAVYDFDRCSGTLSNAQYLPLPVLFDSGWIGLGVAISPNSRFLYTSITNQLYQFDLWDTNVFSTIDTVGIYNGAYAGSAPVLQEVFQVEQLAPDGKIYISCGNAVNVYHVIGNPNAKGDSCKFQQDGIPLPTYTDAIPNYPNYRLGPLTGSACDTLSTLTEDVRAAKEKIIKVFPNPTSDCVVVDYGFTDWNKGEVSLEITNALGQTVYEQTLPMYSGFQKIEVSNYAAGFYIANIKRHGGLVGAAKFVKQ